MTFSNLFGLVLLAGLGGCFPYATTYVHIETKDVKRANEICRQHGAPAAAIYETRACSHYFAECGGSGFDARLGAKAAVVRAPQGLRNNTGRET